MKSRGIALNLLAIVAVVLASTALLRGPEAVARPWISGPYGRLGIATVDGRPDLSDVSITLKRTGCMGWCPDYEITLYGVGVAVYEGKRFVTTMGRWEFDLPATAMIPILDRLQRLDFMNLDHRCLWLSTDVPRYTLALRVGLHERSFMDGTGGISWDEETEHAALHRSVADAMSLIDRVSGIEKWIGSEADRKALYEEQRKREGDAWRRKIKAGGK